MLASKLSKRFFIYDQVITGNLLQAVRYISYGKPGKHNIVHRKPRTWPRAKTKMFLLPAKHHIPEDEAEQVMTLKFRHHDQVSALTQYLWEDYLRNSDVGEAAKIQAAKEEEEHKNLVINNEKLNTEIASKREGRLKIEATEEEKRIKSELHFAREQESKRLSVIEKVVVSEKEQLGMRIKTVDDLERAILSALDNPVDNEFAIDKDGHIYRGRYTKSIQVPLQEREKIPIPLSEGDMILGVEKQQENV